MAQIAHIAMTCRDRIAQERFYTEHFGFRRARVFEAGEPGEFVVLRLGSVCLELFQAVGCPADATGGEQDVGFKHLAFDVDDIDAAAQGLRESGLEVGEMLDVPSLPGLRICFLTDPEGNVIELMHGWQDDPAPPPAPAQ